MNQPQGSSHPAVPPASNPLPASINDERDEATTNLRANTQPPHPQQPSHSQPGTAAGWGAPNLQQPRSAPPLPRPVSSAPVRPPSNEQMTTMVPPRSAPPVSANPQGPNPAPVSAAPGGYGSYSPPRQGVSPQSASTPPSGGRPYPAAPAPPNASGAYPIVPTSALPNPTVSHPPQPVPSPIAPYRPAAEEDNEQPKGNAKTKKGKAAKAKKRSASKKGSAKKTAKPLPAYGSVDERLALSQDALYSAPPSFRVEGGNVVVDEDGPRRKKRVGLGAAGGRWQRFALLGAMILALLLLITNGLYRLAGRALYEPPQLPAAASFPTEGAASYAEMFIRDYFSWDESDPDDLRSEALRKYFPDPEARLALGWDGKGRQIVGSTWTLKTQISDAHRAVITVAADVVPGGVTCAEVGVFAESKTGNYAILSYPSLVGCPPAAKFEVEEDSSEELDNDNVERIKDVLEIFFKAYGESDYKQLRQSVTRNSGIETGLNNSREFDGLADLRVILPKDANSRSRTVYVAVDWKQSGGETGISRSEYTLTMRRDGDAWLVAKLEGGQPSPDVAPRKGGVPTPTESLSPDESDETADDDSGASGDNDGTTSTGP